MTEEEDNKPSGRRVFTNKQGHRSGVLRSKRGESEQDGKARLEKKGWNMDAPHKFTENEDGTGTFRITDKKNRKRKPKAPPAEKSEDAPAKEETSTDDAPTEKKDDSDEKTADA